MVLTPKGVRPVIRQALREDRASQDVTSRSVLPANWKIRARIVARASGVAAGVKMAALTFTTLDPSLRCRLHVHSGAKLSPGKTILTVEGKARSIFAAERTALNFLGHLSGIATLTAKFVKRVRGTRARILDTRKTLPGLRALEKYAVRAGGGSNQRSDLVEAVLIKTNHLLAYSGEWTTSSQAIRAAIKLAKKKARKKFVQIEVTNLRELQAALEAKPDAILLDNWPARLVKRAVVLRKGATPLLEVSGGVTLKSVRAFANTGVDRISIGRLTHSAPSLDVSLKVL